MPGCGDSGRIEGVATGLSTGLADSEGPISNRGAFLDSPWAGFLLGCSEEEGLDMMFEGEMDCDRALP